MLSVAEFVENEEQAALLAGSAATCFPRLPGAASRSCLPDCLQFIQDEQRDGAGVGLKQHFSGDILRAEPNSGGQPGSPLLCWRGRNLKFSWQSFCFG